MRRRRKPPASWASVSSDVVFLVDIVHNWHSYRLLREESEQVLLRCYRTGGCDDTNLNNTQGPDNQETFQAIKPCVPPAVLQAGQRFGTIVSVVSGNAGFTMLLAHCSHMVSDKGYPGQHLQQQCLYLCSSGSIWLG
ncbi:unnamed protein product [Arctogadus glacialis]